jgi:ribosomal-protein-alanine N-acetyltransferase
MMRAEALDSTTPHRIRGMRRGDVPAVAALERAIYPQPWSVRVFFDELARQNRTYLVVEDRGGAVIGYAGLLFVDPDAHVTTLAVEPSSRRHRLGTQLMLALVDEALAQGARNLTLEVRMSNQGAQRLYQRFGFAPVGLRKNYYRDEDALVMWAIDIDGDDYRERVASIRSRLEDA